MKWTLCFALLIFVGSLPQQDHAIGSGTELLNLCRSTEKDSRTTKATDTEDFHSMRCMEYIHGVVSGYQVAEVEFNKQSLCVPSGATTEQGVQVVLKYLRDHPEDLHHGPAVLVMLAMKGAFGCASKP